MTTVFRCAPLSLQESQNAENPQTFILSLATWSSFSGPNVIMCESLDFQADMSIEETTCFVF